MKSFEEIQKMIQDYEKTLAECNLVWEQEKLSPREKVLSDQVDVKFDEICNACAEHIETIIKNFNNVGIELRCVNLEESYKEPYHSFWAKVGTNGYVSKHIKVEGYPYRSNPLV